MDYNSIFYSTFQLDFCDILLKNTLFVTKQPLMDRGREKIKGKEFFPLVKVFEALYIIERYGNVKKGFFPEELPKIFEKLDAFHH